PGCPAAASRWWPPWSGASSSSPTPPRSGNSTPGSSTSSPTGSRPPPSCSSTPAPTCWPSPPSPRSTGNKCGRTTPCPLSGLGGCQRAWRPEGSTRGRLEPVTLRRREGGCRGDPGGIGCRASSSGGWLGGAGGGQRLPGAPRRPGVFAGDGAGLRLRPVVPRSVPRGVADRRDRCGADRRVCVGGVAGGSPAVFGPGGSDRGRAGRGTGECEPAGGGGPGVLRVPGHERCSRRQPGADAAAEFGVAGQGPGVVGSSRFGASPGRRPTGSRGTATARVAGPVRCRPVSRVAGDAPGPGHRIGHAPGGTAGRGGAGVAVGGRGPGSTPTTGGGQGRAGTGRPGRRGLLRRVGRLPQGGAASRAGHSGVLRRPAGADDGAAVD